MEEESTEGVKEKNSHNAKSNAFFLCYACIKVHLYKMHLQVQ